MKKPPESLSRDGDNSGTDGHRTIGRPWHASPLKNSSLAEEAICCSTRPMLPLPHPEMISSLLLSDDPLLVSLPGHPHAGPDPRWKIPPTEWGTVLQRVEQGEPLRHIAHDYSVSYESVRRVLRAARRN